MEPAETAPSLWPDYELPTLGGSEQQFLAWGATVRKQTLIQEMLARTRVDVIGASSAVEFKLRDKSDKALLVTSLARPALTVFKSQLPAVISAAELRDDRAAEILAQLDSSWPFWHSMLPIRAERLPHSQVLFDVGVEVSTYVGMAFKNACACPRPSELSAQVQPLMPVPGHGTYPMGHATQAYVVARLLEWLVAAACAARSLPALGPFAPLLTQAYRLAHRISENRIVAGVHFDVDHWAGRRLGVAIADAMVALAGGPAPADAVGHALLTETQDVVDAIGEPVASRLPGMAPGSTWLACGFSAAVKEWTDFMALRQAPQQAAGPLQATKAQAAPKGRR